MHVDGMTMIILTLEINLSWTIINEAMSVLSHCYMYTCLFVIGIAASICCRNESVLRDFGQLVTICCRTGLPIAVALGAI